MAQTRDLTQQVLKRWTQRETPRHDEVPDERPYIRSLDTEDIRSFDNQGLFYDQSNELIPGIDPEPSGSFNQRWSANSGYVPLM